MKCKIKDCYNESENKHKYCKYHTMKKTNKNGKILLGSYPVLALLIGIGIKKVLKKNKN